MTCLAQGMPREVLHPLGGEAALSPVVVVLLSRGQ